MMANNTNLWLQISAGHGPAECAWAVVKVLEQMQREAPAYGLELKTIEIEPGLKPGTAQSALVSISGAAGVEAFASSWSGTIQLTARSPFRPEHKRKNWFVGIDAIEPVGETRFRAQDVRWETMRASGPGGQHVNRTESAVRVTHMSTGLQATAMEERSQHRNRKLALECPVWKAKLSTLSRKEYLRMCQPERTCCDNPTYAAIRCGNR
jgi:peptide chain release factor